MSVDLTSLSLSQYLSSPSLPLPQYLSPLSIFVSYCSIVKALFIEKFSCTGREQNKRNWSDEEDHAVIETLQEVAIDINWKGEKGWGDGYLVRAEELIAMKVPMAGLKANPHIESRWKYLKRKYHAIADMRASSRFGWDENTKKIQCDKSV
ncbi:hypothetical protein DCAR_0623126 [Daucus carota subsp. sativus]|uniref:Uncharacterized protein n=1 Tax=Daucus carota subsp. sativus TaxID=79200 RepID=A0A161YB34_DAUCS|nr:hypothetical protein DCAR_0623126 [Daucus carota subsp. sativus]